MTGRRKDSTQAIMDGILQFLAGGGILTVALVAPNALKIFDRPLSQMLKTFDKRSQEREVRRVLQYMKQRGLIQYQSHDYEHGIVLTAVGKARLKQRQFEALAIPSPEAWDKKWRLVFFDIPEELKSRRNALTQKLRLTGLQQLQKSIWIHPFPCRGEIEVIAETFRLRRFITYVEIATIDNEQELKIRFSQLLKKQ